jgi:rubredoxin
MGTKSTPARVGRAFSEDEGALQHVGVDLGVELDGASHAASAPPDESVFDDSSFVDFAVAGTEVSGEFRCTDCGYGAIVQRELPQCPMCGGTVWESRDRLTPRLMD